MGDAAASPYGIPGERGLGSAAETGWTAPTSWPGTTDSVPLASLLPKRLFVVTEAGQSLKSLADELQLKGEDVLVLNAKRDGLGDVLNHVVTAGQTYDQILFFGHGTDDHLQIGRHNLTSRSLWRHADALASLGNHLGPDGDLLLYGCDLAASSRGQQLIERLADLTGADVAASTDLTFANLTACDWDLEYGSGAADTKAVTDLLTGLRWQGKIGRAHV